MGTKKTKQTPVLADAYEKQLPAHYIRQSYYVSAMQADLTIQQIRILVAMMQSIQDGVREMFEKNRRNERQQLLLFPDMAEADRVHIDFKFSDVVDRPDSYRDVERVANKFMQMVFRYEDKEEGMVKLRNFAYEVSYPSRGSKRNKIRFTFTKEQAEAVFNFTKYSRYLLSVVMSSKSKHTARLYMLITSARGFERDAAGIFHWYVGYDELRRILGCDEKDASDQWYRKSQKQYKHFKADILRTAQKELKAMAEAGESDCWFDFIELPEGFDGEPQRFDFVVHLSEVSRLERKEDPAEDVVDDKQIMEEW